MITTKICEGIIQFTFIEEKSEFPFNITAITDGEMAILIDTAYTRHAEKVKKYLQMQGIKTFKIFLSHHHEDHFDGCKILKESKTYGSKFFNDDFQEHLQTDEFMKNFIPDDCFENLKSYKFDNFEIDFIYSPGHNRCGFSFLINDKYLYVGDNMIFNKTGKPAIPYIDNNSSLTEHLNSLLNIQRIDPECLLFGHGMPLFDKNEIKKQVEKRLFYLQTILKNKKRVSIEQYLSGNSSEYCGLNFHENNLKRNV